MRNHLRTDEELAQSLHGLYTGACDPEDYEPLINLGLLEKSYAGDFMGAVMGLSRLRYVPSSGER